MAQFFAYVKVAEVLTKGGKMPISRERTLLMIKPDGVEKKIRGDILKLLDAEGLVIKREKQMWLTRELIEQHYKEQIGKPHFKTMSLYLLRGPVVVMEIEGTYAINKVRSFCGATHPDNAEPGTLRRKYGHTSPLFSHIENAVHSSANRQEAFLEISRFFTTDGAKWWSVLLRRIGLRDGTE